MPLNRDWREFVELLNLNGVEYLVVGAFAVAFHGSPARGKAIRLRIAEYRVILTIAPEEITIARVRHRSEAYR
jgi:mRNA-degrading endonuclease RelE of RelBE toxin-antitoxin system